MSKVICDVCGTAFPETAAQCPICGSAKASSAQTAAGAAQPEGENTTAYAYVKGGRFSKSNVRKRNGKSAAPQRRPSQERQNPRRRDSQEEPANRALIVVVILLLLAAALGAAVWVLMHYHIVSGKFYPRDAAVLDLREEEISPRYFDKLRERMPDCETGES